MMMKKITVFCLLSAAFLLLAACSKDEPQTTRQSSLSVVRAQTSFGVLGGTNEVVLQQVPDTAYALDGWLTVSQDAEKVKITAPFNTSTATRNTLLVLKDAKGDSLTINILQEGVAFGLPQEQRIYTGDEALTRNLHVTSNITVEYGSTADWLSVTKSGKTLTLSLSQNTTGKPRVAWVTAQAHGMKDSLRVIQASLADVAGEYTQTALMRNAQKNMVERTTDFKITRIDDTHAELLIDNTYTWKVDFKPGEGFTLMNGKVTKEEQLTPRTKLYHISAVVADDFNKDSETMINGTREAVLLSFDDKGELVFRQQTKISELQTFASYGFNKYTSDKPIQGAFQGIGEVYAQPKLVKK